MKNERDDDRDSDDSEPLGRKYGRPYTDPRDRPDAGDWTLHNRPRSVPGKWVDDDRDAVSRWFHKHWPVILFVALAAFAAMMAP